MAWRRPLKYRNVKTELDGLRFDSKGESKRWAELCLLERAGEIKNLKRQVPFKMAINGVHICTLVADFAYFEPDRYVVEDFKSPITAKNPVFRLKSKLFAALYPGVELRIIGA